MTIKEFKSAVNIEARVAALLVQTASKFSSRLLLRRDNMEVNCKSLMGIISMCVASGDVITISANGADETEAVDTLCKMLAEAR